MKKKIFTILCAMALSMFAAVTFAQERLLPNLKKMDNLETVYVGKSLLRMLGNENIEGMNLANGMLDAADFIKYIDSIEVVSASSEKAANYVRPLTEKAIAGISGLELAMQTEDDGDYVRIYFLPTTDGNAFKRMIVINGDKSDYNIIDMTGNIPLDILSGSFPIDAEQATEAE